MKTFVFKLYRNKKNRYLHGQINIAADIYNHCIALHKRYYRRFKKHLNANRLKVHLTRLKKLSRFEHWKPLGSQAIQDVVERIDRAYKRFFKGLEKGERCAPPGFKAKRRYKSFTLKQAGYAWLGGNPIRIGSRIYRFHQSRDIEGRIKTVTIKRDTLGDLYLYFVTDLEQPQVQTAAGQMAGFDFGLKVFLTGNDGTEIDQPLFFKAAQRDIRNANRSLSRKRKGSKGYRKAARNLARVHRQVACRRRDHHYKLARQLCETYSHLFLEDLNIKGMQRLWGKNIGDLGFAQFVDILKHQAVKFGATVVEINRWFPSSKMCSDCGAINEALILKDRDWLCGCGSQHKRDLNAAINIFRVGASTLGLDDVRLPREAVIA